MPFELLRNAPGRKQKMLSVVWALAVSVSSAFLSAQTATPATAPPPSQTTVSQAVPDHTSSMMIKATARLVSLEVVARDRQGRPVRGLTGKDFEVLEQVPPSKDQRPQSVSAFQAVDWAELSAASPSPARLPPGVYSNLVSRQKPQVPPTILLFDAINTDLEAQMQVHRQMVGILKSIPEDVPVAVFLMSDRLRLLQSFTTDSKLLREAAAKSLVVGQTAPDRDPMDDPTSLSAALEDTPNLPPGLLQSLQGLEQGTFWFAVSVRMRRTLDSLRGIARYLDGYPGRKNILWISTSFPLQLAPDSNASSGAFADLRAFTGDMQEVGSALIDGKIAIYPVDAGGVRTQSMFEASVPKLRQPASGANLGAAIQREDNLRQSAQQVMRDLADETGGRVCTGDNDLADCIKKAVDDSSSYYELSYYPDAGAFHGEYHRIIVKTSRPGVHLSFREGYYARQAPEKENAPAQATQQGDPALNRAACEDPLPSTAILLMVKSIPPDEAGAAKYFLAIDPRMLTFSGSEAGTHKLGMSVAACTFDKTGQPLQYLQKNSLAKLNDQQFAVASHGITQTFQFAPKAGVARIRLLVRDTPSGHMGSVDVPYREGQNPTVPATAEKAPPANP
jgi:VWFA-related protein